MTKNEILTYLTDHKKEFKVKYGVTKIGLFGSYARDDADENSDIDIIVEMEPKFKNFFALKRTIEDTLNKSVDLGLIESLRLLVKKEIERDVIYV